MSRSAGANPRSVVQLRQAASPRVDAESVLAALATVVVAVQADGIILYLNNAAEQFFCGSSGHLSGTLLQQLVPADSPLFALIRQVSEQGHPVAEYRVTLSSPRIGEHLVNIHAAPMQEPPGAVVLSLQERSLTTKIERSLSYRGAARSVTALAAMLAHEVKNPVSGIRGAAQLLEQSVEAGDRPLTQLIRDEADRVCALVDRMEVFAAGGPVERGPVNIHEVLSRVRMLAESSFGRHARFAEIYDPSLPSVYGNKDQLTQVFLNLVKNAAEAVPDFGGEVIISTAYRHGVRFAAPASRSRVHLPLAVTVQDNGAGIPEDLKPHLFDPFVTSKPRGTGLGLALVAKIIGDHGGVIEFESRPLRTEFRVMLPMAPADESEP